MGKKYCVQAGNNTYLADLKYYIKHLYIPILKIAKILEFIR